jgi:hypothetical protein
LLGILIFVVVAFVRCYFLALIASIMPSQAASENKNEPIAINLYGDQTNKSLSISSFVIIEDEEQPARLRKRELALRYLTFINDEADFILKSSHALAALKYILYTISEKRDKYEEIASELHKDYLLYLLPKLIKEEYGNTALKYLTFNLGDTFHQDEINAVTVDSSLLESLCKSLHVLCEQSTLFCSDLLFRKPARHRGEPRSSLNILLGLIDHVQSGSEESFLNVNRTAFQDLVYAFYYLSLYYNLNSGTSIMNGSASEVSKNTANVNQNDIERILNGFALKFASFDYFSFHWMPYIVIENFKNVRTHEKENNEANAVAQQIETFPIHKEFFDSIFEAKEQTTSAQAIHLHEIALRYLDYMSEPEQMFKNELTMNLFYYMANSTYMVYEPMNKHFQDKFVHTIVDLLKYLYNELSISLRRLQQQQHTVDKSKHTDIKKTLMLIENILLIVQMYSNMSIKFCNRYHEVNSSIETLFKFIVDEELSDFLVSNLTKRISSYMLRGCFDGVIASLHNLSRVAYKYRYIWAYCNDVQACINFAEKLGPIDERYRSDVYMIIANIATDAEIDTLPEIRVAIKNIIMFIERCAKLLGESESPPRLKIQLEEDSALEEICYILVDQDHAWHLVELLIALHHLAVNDNIKLDVYDEYNMKEHLRTIIYKGNETEKEYALRVLYQLCFDDSVCAAVLRDHSLNGFISYLSKSGNFKSKRLIKNCNGILWMLDNNNNNNNNNYSSNNNNNNYKNLNNIIDKNTQAEYVKPHKEKEKEQVITPRTGDTVEPAYNQIAEQKKEENEHIMISYNRESRELCLQIKNEIEKMGFKVWIDVEDIHGSSLESMANAIERSHCVLMGMTEKYKSSPNCRLEAEYAV